MVHMCTTSSKASCGVCCKNIVEIYECHILGLLSGTFCSLLVPYARTRLQIFSQHWTSPPLAARAREDVEKLDVKARKKMARLRHIALVSGMCFGSLDNKSYFGASIFCWSSMLTSPCKSWCFSRLVMARMQIGCWLCGLWLLSFSWAHTEVIKLCHVGCSGYEGECTDGA